ncbi:Ig-like domain-containing protein [Vibrio mediterranei]|nr:Ig-like domain-containing protein [Vibrio mediterranei]
MRRSRPRLQSLTLERIAIHPNPVITKGKSDLTLAAGNRQPFEAIGYYANGTSKALTSTVSWRSSNNESATFASSGVLLARSAGYAEISATLGDITSQTLSVVVTNAVLTTIQVTPALSTVAKGQTETLTVMAIYSDGSSSNVTERVTWVPADPNIASVNPNDVLTGVNMGSTTIMAKLDGVESNPVSVAVTDAVITSIQLTRALGTMAKGQTAPLNAIAIYSDGSSSNVTERVTWVPADPNIASVNPNDVLTGVNMGSTTIMAKLDGVESNPVSVTVTDAVITSIQLTPALGAVAKGQTEPLTAMAIYSDGSSSNVTQRITWAPANPDIASVNPNGVLTGVNVGSTTIVAKLDGVESNPGTVTVTEAVITSIQVTPSMGSVAKGQTEPLTAMAIYSDGSSSNVTQRVTWAPADLNVASVNPNGVLTGVNVGSTTIVAKFDEVDSNPVSVTVTEAVVTSIQVTPSMGSVAKGQTEPLTAMAIYSDGSSSNVTQRVTWAPADPNLASVNPNGVLTGVNVGSTTIVAKLAGIDSNPVSVTVIEAVVTSVQVTPSVGSVAKGQTEPLTAMAIYSDGSSSNVTQRITWAPANPDIATVNPNGVLTGVNVGSTTIVAKLDGVESNPGTVTVTEAVLSTIQVTPSPVAVAKGQQQVMLATASYSDGSSSNVTQNVTWTPADSNLATVDPNGVLTGVNVGSTTIVASLDGVESNVLDVSVTNAVLTSINVTPNSIISIAKGQTEPLIAMGTYSDSSTLNVTNSVTWSSTDTGVATVSPSGTLSAVASGNSTVTAKLNGLDSNDVLVSVTAAIVTSVAVATDDDESSLITLPKGQTVQLKATAIYSDNSTSIVTNTATWRSENSGKATINPTGLLRGIDSGNTSITASVDGVDSGALRVSITNAVITAIAVEPSSTSVAKGQSVPLKAFATMSDNSTQNVTNSVTWRSAATTIATITPTGVLSGVKYGTTTFSAFQDGVTSNPGSVNVMHPNIPVCGNVQGQPIDTSPQGGINNTDPVNAAGTCLKIREIEYRGRKLWFSSSPSKGVLETLDYSVSNSANNTEDTYSAVVSNNAPIGEFGLFRMDGIGKPQGERWCGKLSAISFAGRANWVSFSQERAIALYNEGPLSTNFNWPTRISYWTTTVDNSLLFRFNFSSGSSYYGQTSASGYMSCVSEF